MDHSHINGTLLGSYRGYALYGGPERLIHWCAPLSGGEPRFASCTMAEVVTKIDADLEPF